MKLDLWKVLILEDNSPDDFSSEERLDEIFNYLSSRYNLDTIRTNSSEQFLDTFNYQKDLAVILLEYHQNHNEVFFSLLNKIRFRNKYIPIIAFSRDRTIRSFKQKDYRDLTDFFFILTDSIEFLANRTIYHVENYIKKVVPIFLRKLIEYNQQGKYPWHTPGHMGGDAFRKDPTGKFFYDYLGENVFRSDLSISVPELGSLLDHSGPIGESEKNAAKTFGATFTNYVLNGTSSVNQIIWRSRVTKNELALVDRNCHKSLNYAMVGSQALPTYMVPRRNAFGIIGPVALKEFSREGIEDALDRNPLISDKRKNDPIQMAALTNSTYDGLCYNVNKIKRKLYKSVKNMHFDEAWFPYAKFHPIYKDHYAMADDERNVHYPPIFASQSTHKLLAAFSQASMLHVKDGTDEKIDPEIFNEAYMMYGSTSPQYNLIASLDVSQKMMELDGYQLLDDTITDAVNLRKDLARVKNRATANHDWFFEPWQPKKIKDENGKKIKFEDASTEYLTHSQKIWELSSKDNWHGFDNIEDHYVMLDPTKITIRTPGIKLDGKYEKEGIPASIVTNYLIDHGVVCEKTDYYSFLILNSIGTTKSKQGALLIELSHFKELYDANTPMKDVFPKLCHENPGFYDNEGLRDHCQRMHQEIQQLDLLHKMNDAFEVIPTPEMTPADAAQLVFKGRVKKVTLNEMMDHTAAVMVVPYPPGIPILMGGEKINQKSKPIINYLQQREKFEQDFPGYYSDIHGIEAKTIDGKRRFTTMVLDS